MSEARERRPGPPRGKHRQHKKPKGIALDGWLIIDKPTGVGSTDVVTLCNAASMPRNAGMVARLIRWRRACCRLPLARRRKPCLT